MSNTIPLNGLFLLTSSTLSLTSKSIFNLLGVKKVLMDKRRLTDAISFNNNINPVLYIVQWSPSSIRETKGQQQALCDLSSLLYSQGNAQCPEIDIRLLLNDDAKGLGRPNVPIDLVLVEGSQTPVSLNSIRSFVNEYFHVSNPDFSIDYLEGEDSVFTELEDQVLAEVFQPPYESIDEDVLKKYHVVAVGVTFDRIQINAHKILLSESIFRCTKEIIVAVSSDEIINSKLLMEITESCETRVEQVKRFLEDVAPHLKHRVVIIDDLFIEPTITDINIGLIVISSERIKEAQKINEIRQSKYFSQLDIHHIPLFNYTLKQSAYEENKIRSQRIPICDGHHDGSGESNSNSGNLAEEFTEWIEFSPPEQIVPKDSSGESNVNSEEFLDGIQVSPPEQCVPIDTSTTPIVTGRLHLLRHAKRKFSDVYPEFYPDYKRRSKPLLKTTKTKVVVDNLNNAAIASYNKDSKITRDDSRPRIIQKFKFPPPPNPISKELQKSLAKGRLFDIRKDIRGEMLMEIGCFPKFDESDFKKYYTSKNLFVTQAEIRTEINSQNRDFLKKQNPHNTILLHQEYEQLLEQQTVQFQTFISSDSKNHRKKSNISSINNNSSDFSKTSASSVETNGIIHLKTEKGKFLVEQASVLIPKLTDAEIQAIFNSTLPTYAPENN